MSAKSIYADALAEVWVADCLDASQVDTIMAGRVADALIFDAPYSEATHLGHGAGRMSNESIAKFGAKHDDRPTRESRYAKNLSAKNKDGRRGIDYEHFTAEKVSRFANIWLPRCSGWVISITDHILAPMWASAFASSGLYTFTPIPLVETGSRVRLPGDGPSNWACWLICARPKTRAFASWGALPGAYVQAAERDMNSFGGSDRIVGGKPLRSMSGIVGDYSRRGALICDPFFGGGTTGLAAKQLGRACIGIEQSEERAKLSAKRIRNTHEQGHLFERGAQ